MTSVDERASRVWTDLCERFGDDVRAVVYFTPTEFASRLRADVEAAYDETTDRKIVDRTIVNQLTLRGDVDHFEAGAFESVVTVFERAYVVHYPETLAGKSGYIVSIERGDAAALEVVEECVAYLDDAVGELSAD